MSHDHGEADGPYYVDQLCLIALSASFGAVCLTLYLLKSDMLHLMLGPQFHLMVLWSGFILLGLAVTRSLALWREARSNSRLAPRAEPCCEHSHGDGPADAQGHDHADHGWAPWRYVLLLLPIFLFLLGFPNKGPAIRAANANLDLRIDLSATPVAYAGLIGTGADFWP